MWKEKRTTVAKIKIVALIELLKHFAATDSADAAKEDSISLAEYHRGRGNGFAMAARWMKRDLLSEAVPSLVGEPHVTGPRAMVKDRVASHREKGKD